MSFPFLPDDAQLTPEEDLQAAVAGALAIPEEVVPATPDVPEPFGMTWEFDFESGRFVWMGSSPSVTTGFGAVIQWCLMALHTARYANAAVSDEFGMENPDEPLGEFAVGEIVADWKQHVTEALLVHDRITAVENIDLTWDPSVGILYVNSLDVLTDEQETLTLSDIAIERSAQ